MAELDQLYGRIISCVRCPRLVAHRRWAAENPPRRFRGEVYWARPLTGFGDVRARLLVVGLAPAAHGGNRTGRMFTGDSSGNTLMRALYHTGFASQPYSERRDDSLTITDAYITAVVRCPPPENRPTSTEIANCIPYLLEEMRILENVQVIICLGGLAFNTVSKIMREHGEMGGFRPAFKHGATYRPGGKLFGRPAPTIIASYHPSRQNTQTGRLTQRMLNQIFLKARKIIEQPAG